MKFGYFESFRILKHWNFPFHYFQISEFLHSYISLILYFCIAITYFRRKRKNTLHKINSNLNIFSSMKWQRFQPNILTSYWPFQIRIPLLLVYRQFVLFVNHLYYLINANVNYLHLFQQIFKSYIIYFLCKFLFHIFAI